MKYRLLASAAALALAVSIYPASAQQSPAQGGGMNRPNTGPSQHHEQDQGIKTGQTNTGSGEAAQAQGSQNAQGTGTADKGGNSEPKKVTQPPRKEGSNSSDQDQKKSSAADRDQDRNQKASDRDNDRDKNARSTDRERDRNTARSTDRDRDTRSTDRGRDTKSSDRDRDSKSADRDRDRSTADNRSSGKSVSLNTQQKTKISASIKNAHVEPLKNVNFSVRVGAEIPAYVHFHALPADIAAIVPEYRDYNYVVVQDRIVIVEPRTRKIVTIIDQPRQASRGESRRSHLSSRERSVIKNRTASTRQHPQVREHYTERYVVGERVPDDIEFYEMPERVYIEEPSVRRYRYIPRNRGVVVVEPRDRRVIDLID